MVALKDKRIGVALTGSHCTVEAILPQLEKLALAGALLFPILSPALEHTDTRFGTAAALRRSLEQITGRRPWVSIVDVEPIGPKKLLDLLLIAPCSGNTMAKLANGIVAVSYTHLDVYKRQLEYSPHLFRPPRGLYNGVILEQARRHRCRTVLWSVESYDYISRDAAEVSARVGKRLHRGAIINFRAGSPLLHEALPQILNCLLYTSRCV